MTKTNKTKQKKTTMGQLVPNRAGAKGRRSQANTCYCWNTMESRYDESKAVEGRQAFGQRGESGPGDAENGGGVTTNTGKMKLQSGSVASPPSLLKKR